ncbi:MAG: spermidine synthase [Geobacter sp.]|nr:MAG: spermidine synthase [Geobacter sp.]
MGIPVTALIYFVFFLSGAAALIYEMLWVRYLSLIFGGSHLAVTTVLAVFMGGLALGSSIIGKRIGNAEKLLRLYGFLELGIAFSALMFWGLMRIYPLIYIPLAQLNETSPLYLSIIRVAFATFALILPTTLMGGTLPVLSSFVAHRLKGLGRHLSFLYGINTIGAVVGTAFTGFYFLVNYSVSTTLIIAIIINVLVGVIAIALQAKTPVVVEGIVSTGEPVSDPGIQDVSLTELAEDTFPLKLVLWGIGVSGFCALAYEVLWTRILSIIIGASTYGFAILLMAFLAGIGLGSSALGALAKVLGTRRKEKAHSLRNLVILFGAIQITIGLSALFVSIGIQDLPTHSSQIRDVIYSMKFNMQPFKIGQLDNFITAFSFMFIPAFFMGSAFPLAGKIHGYHKKVVGQSVGEILSFNTVGAIFGSAASGFVFIYLFGIQRSLEIIILINIGYGLLVMVSIRHNKVLNALTACVALAVILVPVFNPTFWQLWDPKMYAVYQANTPDMFSTPEKKQKVLDNNDIRYYAEGTNSIISSVQSSDALYFITNGRVEASNLNQDRQCQYTLGHLPMLLHPNPKKVFVLGTGSGMTLGATSVHPSVEQITLAEIEPKVLGVAKSFGVYNHYVLNKPNPKLKIVFNDGRNFLLTTKDKFDVITADPVHPWFSGAGYLYTTEYFKIAADHLNPGGIICQWLPLYELTEENLQSVVKTLRQNFKYTMIWLTHVDAELIGSNSPIIIDEKKLEERIKVPEVKRDLEQVNMGSAEAFLSYFIMGNAGTKAYSEQGIVNTDNNLYLEFSAPHSIGKTQVLATNVMDLLKHRESILPYIRLSDNEPERLKQKYRWEQNQKAAVMYDKAHVMYLTGNIETPECMLLMSELESKFPEYAPRKFLQENYDDRQDIFAGTPKLLKQIVLDITNKDGEPVKFQFSAVLVQKNKEKARVYFVDNASRLVFGTLRVKGANKEPFISSFIEDLTKAIEDIYTQQRSQAVASGHNLPQETTLFPEIKRLVELRVEHQNSN